MNDFLWGGATASYQCEGGWQEGGRVESMWDVYLHENHLENGDVASDHYPPLQGRHTHDEGRGTEQLPLFTGLAQNYQKQGRGSEPGGR